MKKILLSIASLAIIGASTAQINLDFETWTAGNPNGWITSNQLYTPITVTQAAGNGGGSAIKLTSDSVTQLGGTAKDTLALAFQFIPNAPVFGFLKFDYKTVNPGLDTGALTIAFWENGAPAYSSVVTLTPHPNTFYTIPNSGFDLSGMYSYATANNIPTDSVFISFVSSAFGTKTIGTELYVDNMTLSTTTGIYDVFSNVTVKTYPNPTADVITFEIDNNTNGVIEIYNANGALINTTNTNGNITNISLENEVKGTYLYRVKNSNGNIVKTGKVIKQ